MTKKKLEMFRTILTERMNKLVKEARVSLGEFTEVQENLADLSDQASAEQDRNFIHRVKDRQRKHLLKIKSLMEKIDDGTYGICEVCGEDIPEDRLKARPETTQCIECKTEMEDHERRMQA